MSLKIITEENEHLCSYDINKAKDSSDYARIKDALFAKMRECGNVIELIPDSTVVIIPKSQLFRCKLQLAILELGTDYNCRIDAVIK